MGNDNQKTQLLYKSWEHLKGAIDRLDQSKAELAKAELEMETVLFLMEQDVDQTALK